MGDRQPLEPSGRIDHVDEAPVAQVRHRESAQPLQGGRVVERRAEHLARLREKLEPPAGGAQALDRILRVAARLALTCEENRAVHGERGAAREAERKSHLGGAVHALRLRPRQGQRPEDVAAGDQRHGHRGSRGQPGHQLEMALVASGRGQRLGIELGEDHRLPGPKRPGCRLGESIVGG